MNQDWEWVSDVFLLLECCVWGVGGVEGCFSLCALLCVGWEMMHGTVCVCSWNVSVLLIPSVYRQKCGSTGEGKQNVPVIYSVYSRWYKWSGCILVFVHIRMGSDFDECACCVISICSIGECFSLRWLTEIDYKRRRRLSCPGLRVSLKGSSVAIKGLTNSRLVNRAEP